MSTRVEQLEASNVRRSATVELLILAVPIIAMTVSRMLMGFIDFVMVSELGTEAQAAISPASMFVFILGVLGLGVANAVQTFVSQADGRGRPEEGGGYAWQTFYIAAVFGALTLPAMLTVEHWFGWIATLGKHTDPVRIMEQDYIRIALWGVAPAIICIGLNGFFNGAQRPWIAFIAVVASLVTNVAGNWLLIFGNLGFPALGIEGAAYATVFAWVVRAAVLTGALLLPQFDERYRTRHTLAFSWSKMKGLIRIGGPTSLGWMVDLGSWTAFMVLIMPSFGEVAMAASNIGMQLMHLSFMPAIGIGIALCSQVGYAVGEGRPEGAMLRTRVAFRVTGVYMTLVGIIYLLLREPVISLFTDNPDVIAAGAQILIWVAIFQVFDAMAITHMNALRGAGDTKWPAILMAICCWGIFIGGGLFVRHMWPEWGINGPWAMCTLFIIVIGLVLLRRWLGRAWQSIRLFDEHPQHVEAAEPPEEAPMAASMAGRVEDDPESESVVVPET